MQWWDMGYDPHSKWVSYFRRGVQLPAGGQTKARANLEVIRIQRLLQVLQWAQKQVFKHWDSWYSITDTWRLTSSAPFDPLPRSPRHVCAVIISVFPFHLFPPELNDRGRCFLRTLGMTPCPLAFVWFLSLGETSKKSGTQKRGWDFSFYFFFKYVLSEQMSQHR